MEKDIAIIGIAGRFPEAENIFSFYGNLLEGRDSLRSLSRNRKIKTTIPVDKEYQLVGYLENIDAFDYDFFRLSLAEAQHMDPRQRLLLEVVYESFENAGYNVDAFAGSDTALFIADTALDYYKHAEQFAPTLLTGNLNPMTAGRIARFFDLRGNAQMIDTACSSGLVALKQACDELLLGNAAQALVCGINLILFPAEKDKPDKLGIVSPDGKSKSFSKDANGSSFGEAAVTVLLKPLQKARLDGDVIHAVIKSVAVNQDGHRSASLTAPDSIAQAEVIKKAWRKAGIDPRTITYIEAHGSATALGDPIEIDGINIAFQEYTTQKRFCAVSSVKSNIGHTDTAAGLVGLAKGVLSLKYRKLFPSLHFTAPNPLIDFNNSAVYVNSTLSEWQLTGTGPRRAGISSFGMSGTNCHAVLEEAPGPGGPAGELPTSPYQLFTVSAASAESLRANLTTLVKAIEQNPALSLADVSYTLNCGRKHYAWRAAAVARSREELCRDLKSLLEEKPVPEALPPVDKVFFVFSADAEVSDALLDSFCTRHALFREHFEQCKAAAAGPPTQAFRNFCFQYCFYKLLEHQGIKSNLLIGEGTGRVVASVLKGDATLAAGLERVRGEEGKPSANLHDRLHALLTRHPGRVLFAEMGPSGNVSLALQQLQNSWPLLGVITLHPDPATAYCSYLQQLYLANVPLNWPLIYQDHPGRRAELPTYQFSRKRCWIKDAPVNDAGEWAYRLAWEIAEEQGTDAVPAGRTILMCMPDEATGEALTARLQRDGNRCLRVYPGSGFANPALDVYRMDWNQEAAYKQLADALAEQQTDISDIIHLGGCREVPETGIERVEPLLRLNLYAHFYLTRALHHVFKSRSVGYLVVTRQARKVSASDQDLFSERATAHGYMQSLAHEYPLVSPKCIDIDDCPDAELARLLRYELAAGPADRMSGYRRGIRYTPVLRPVRTLQPSFRPSHAVKAGGVYLVTGGASGIGLEVCRYLAGHLPVTLIVLGRRPHPGTEHWPAVAQQADHPMQAAAAVYAALEAKGSRVYYYQADVSDAQQVTAVWHAVKTKHGKLNGIVHSAGLPGSRRIIAHTIESFREPLRAKVLGTVLLHTLTHEDQPDFFVLFSSLAAYQGGKGNGNYSAANMFLESFALELSARGVPATVITWPAWHQTGMMHRLISSLGEDPHEATMLSTTEGINVLEWAMQRAWSDLIILKEKPGGQMPHGHPRQTLPGARTEEAVTGSPAGGPNHGLPMEGWTETERKVTQIWYEVLRASNIRREDDFFELRGHSLNGLQVVNRVIKEFNVEFNFKDLFNHPTIKGLAERIDDLRRKEAVALLGEIPPAGEQPYYDLSHAQMQFWLSDQLGEGVAANVPLVLEFSGELSLAALEKALFTLMSRHEILRTVFVVVAGVPKQAILGTDAFTFAIRYTDLRQQEAPDSLARKHCEERLGVLFNLATGPLLEAEILQVKDDTYVFFLKIHHILIDAWSSAVITRELLTLYNVYKKGGDNPLPPPRIQYKDYVYWMQQQLTGEKMQVAERYWVKQLSGPVPVLNLPTYQERPARKTANADVLVFQMDHQLLENLKSVNRACNATLFMVLVASVNTLLYHYTRQLDVMVGSSLSLREHPDLENQIGLYLNQIAIRTHFQAEDTFTELMDRVKHVVLDAYAHKHYPFTRLLEKLNLPRDPSRSPLFDVMVDLTNENTAWQEIRMENVHTTQVMSGQMRSSFDLAFNFREYRNSITAKIIYRNELFKPRFIEEMAGVLMHLFTQISINPAASVGVLSRAMEQEQEQMRKLRKRQSLLQNYEKLMDITKK